MFFSNIIYNTNVTNNNTINENDLKYNNLNNIVKNEIINNFKLLHNVNSDDDEYFNDMEELFISYNKNNIVKLFINNLFSKS